MKTGIELIAEERRRQVESEGWTPEHDAEHTSGQLAAAAAVYAAPIEIYRDATSDEMAYDDQTQFNYIPDRDNSYYSLRRVWPWQKHELKRGDRMRELTKAGALIAAEIDRLQRQVITAPPPTRETEI